MVKNHALAKAISDAAWGNFFIILKNKAENAGRKVKEVNPSGTSQYCLCGNRVKKSLADRWHSCQKCGLSAERDVVSAKLILEIGLGRNPLKVTYSSS